MENQTETRITNKTFQKSDEEKIALANAKAKHKKFLKESSKQVIVETIIQ